MHTMYVPIVLRYVRSILLVSCIFSFSHIHTSLLDPRSNQELWQQFFIKKNFISQLRACHTTTCFNFFLMMMIFIFFSHTQKRRFAHSGIQTSQRETSRHSAIL